MTSKQVTLRQVITYGLALTVDISKRRDLTHLFEDTEIAAGNKKKHGVVKGYADFYGIGAGRAAENIIRYEKFVDCGDRLRQGPKGY